MALTTKYGKEANIYSLPVGKKRKPKLFDEKTVAQHKKKSQKFLQSLEPPAYVRGLGDDFYRTREWQKARFHTLHRSDGKCVLCGAGKADGAIMQVDHIKPRSKFPELELDTRNLQVLCKDCNMGKGNADW